MRPAVLACIILTAAAATCARAEEPGVLKQEFLYEQASFPSCHASTIVQTPQGLCAAFFGGSDEGESDVGIWLCRLDNGATAWSAPVQVATGDTPEQNNRRFPCWNPVLFQAPNGPLLLFYKVGPTPDKWWGMLVTSGDHGRTWSKPRKLPDGILGPVKNKPVLLAGGTLLCGSSTETGGWFVHMESTRDLGATWTKTEPLNDGHTIESIQPALLVPRDAKPDGTTAPIQILCRTQQGKIAESFSRDDGKTWTPLRLTDLPNPDSGIDAVTLADGRRLLVYNPTREGRTPLSTALSDDGKTWKAGPTLETAPGEYSYPAVIQTTDGKVHITYTWKRQRIRHAVLDPAQFKATDLKPTP